MNEHVKNILIGFSIVLPAIAFMILVVLYQSVLIGLAVLFVITFILLFSYMIGLKLTRKQ